MTADGIGRGGFARARKIRVGLALGMGGLLALAWPAAPSGARQAASYSTFAVAPFQLSASAPLAPASGALFGAWHKSPTEGWSTVDFAEFESVVGRKMDVNHRFHAWGGTYWPSSSDRWDVLNGRIPLASLGGSDFPGLDAVNNGSEDEHIAALADRIREFGAPLFFRPWRGMNRSGTPWGGPQNNTGDNTNGPHKYRQAWRRMHRIFSDRGATNAIWVWSPSCKDWPDLDYNHWSNYYPGDAYVDWVACDAYNWGTTTGSGWRSFASLFGGSPSVYSDYPHKPFMASETGSCDQGGDKGKWFRDAQRDIKALFPNLRAFIYFDAQGSECDWRVTSSFDALVAYRAFAADPYFNTAAAPTPEPTPTPTPESTPTPTPEPTPGPGSNPVIAAAGDIATSSMRAERTAKLLDALNPDAVLTLGDNAYPDGTLAQFMSYYDPTWGRHKARTRPVPGNHEYHDPLRAAPDYFTYFGTAAGEPGKGYYSFDVGSWHIVALNSSYYCSLPCGAGSEQEQWLRRDLAANASRCTLAYWHQPRFSSGTHGSSTRWRAFWQALYDHGADVVLNGHDHNYQRFAPMDPDGNYDPANGIREWVVGTGGASQYVFAAPIANSEAHSTDTLGILKLVLKPDSYDWEFIPEAGKTYTDAGTASCH